MRLVDATFYYKGSEEPALDGVNLEIPRGQLTAVLGPTNAGKTTLCLLLSGIVPHLTRGDLLGEVTVAGVDSATLSDDRVATLTRHVGSVFQNPESQLFGLSVEEDVAFGPENLRVPPAEIRTIITETLEVVGLAGFEKRSPFRLSGGQKQRVAIAAALALRPDLLALDEPVSELDPVGKAEVLDLVQRLSQQGRASIVVADHDPEWILELADHVVVLSGGRVLTAGPPREVFAEPAALRAAGLHLPAAVELTDRLVRSGLLPEQCTTERAAVEAIRGAISSGKILPSADPVRTATAGGRAPGPDHPEDRQDTVIKARGLGFAYPGEPPALRDIDLSIERNEFVALVGANGSGKTTLAKHFNGILTPTAGQIRIFGDDPRVRGLSATAQRVGYVYQNPDHQIFARTVFDEVAFGPRNRGVSGAELTQVVTEALTFVGLEADHAKEPFFLGLGARQRLAVASVLAMRPDVLVVDEPDTGQDARGAREMMEVIDRLHVSGKTIVMITHTMDLVARHAHRVVAMSSGRIIADAPTRDFFASDALAQLSLRAPQVARICTAAGSPVPLLTVDEAFAWLAPAAPAAPAVTPGPR